MLQHFTLGDLAVHIVEKEAAVKVYTPMLSTHQTETVFLVPEPDIVEAATLSPCEMHYAFEEVVLLQIVEVEHASRLHILDPPQAVSQGGPCHVGHAGILYHAPPPV